MFFACGWLEREISRTPPATEENVFKRLRPPFNSVPAQTSRQPCFRDAVCWPSSTDLARCDQRCRCSAVGEFCAQHWCKYLKTSTSRWRHHRHTSPIKVFLLHWIVPHWHTLFLMFLNLDSFLTLVANKCFQFFFFVSNGSRKKVSEQLRDRPFFMFFCYFSVIIMPQTYSNSLDKFFIFIGSSLLLIRCKRWQG